MEESSISGMWWRYSDYQIIETQMPQNLAPVMSDQFRYIRPAPGATLETYTLNVSGGEIGEGSESVTYEDIVHLDPQSDSEVLDWCRRFGLLGILPQRAFLMRLAPRWRPLVDNSDRFLFPAQTSYSRTPVGWHPVSQLTMKSDDSIVITIDDEDRMEDWNGTLVDSEETIHSPASVIISPLFSGELQERGLGEAIGRYFPSVEGADLDTFEYPTPLSDQFWRLYGESLSEFRAAIGQFVDMVRRLGNQGPLEQLPEDALGDLSRARAELHTLTSASPALGIDNDGNFLPKWAFTSLIGAFGFSVWQSLIGGSSVKHCARPRCRNVFLTAQYNRIYCSPKCTQAEQKARQRGRKRNEQASTNSTNID